MRRYGFTLLQALGVLGLIIVVFILWPPHLWPPGRDGTRESKRRIACANNLKQIALGLKQYSADNNDRFPPVALNTTRISSARPFGWADAIQPYIKSFQVYQCRAEPTATSGSPTQVGYTDYWYNMNCAGQKEKSFTFISMTVITGDGAIGGGDARYSVTSEPKTTDETSRHLGGNNFAFVDGHVKWYLPGKVTTTPPDGKNASFAVK